MIARLRLLAFLVLGLGALADDLPLGPSKLGPRQVVVVCNRNEPASLAVAQAYLMARKIDPSQLVTLDCPTVETITRQQFQETVQEPLRRHFSAEGWWKLFRGGGRIEAAECRFRVIVLAYGMPLRISRDAVAAQGKVNEAAINEASVDSELALLGVFDAPIDSGLKNPYFQKKEDFSEFRVESLVIVSRLDGPDAVVAQRLATEAVEVEQAGGPWGRAVIDLAGFHPLGDQWLGNIYARCWKAGIPAQVDRHKWCLPSFYPLSDCALYYGWYDGQRSGFLLDPSFRFRPGAVAVHIHSFSAQSLRSPDQFWSAPLVARGATATVGNVFEPYLQMTHYLDTFNDALLDGYTLGEASLMSLPSLSWMNILVGDPLYRPFAGRQLLTSTRFERDANASYKAIYLALARWGQDPAECIRELRAAGERTKDGTLLEGAGLLGYRERQYDKARRDFAKARSFYPGQPDQIRCGMLAAECLLAARKKPEALESLRELAKDSAAVPQSRAVWEHLRKLDPPPPPPQPPAPPTAAPPTAVPAKAVPAKAVPAKAVPAKKAGANPAKPAR